MCRVAPHIAGTIVIALGVAMVLGCRPSSTSSPSAEPSVDVTPSVVAEPPSPHEDVSIANEIAAEQDKDIEEATSDRGEQADGQDPVELANAAEAAPTAEAGEASETASLPASPAPDEDEQVVDDELIEQFTSHRVLLPTSAGILLVAMEVRLGDQTLADAFADRIAEVLRAAANGSATPTWQMVFDHVRSDPRIYGRAPPNAPGQAKDMIRRYDRNRNGRPDPDELARFLFRDSGFAGPFRLYGTDGFRHVNRSESRLFQMIDLDDDGLIDRQEFHQITDSLLRLDRNSDQGISLSEAITHPERGDSAWDRRRTHRRGTVAMDLDGYVDWSLVSYALDGPIGDDSHETVTAAIGSLDADGNQSISSIEAEQLLVMEPDVHVRIQFAGGDPVEPTVQVESVCEELQTELAIDHVANAVVLSWPSLRLRLEVNDLPERNSRIPFQAFAMIDANNDGFLEADEIPAAAADEISVERLDRDGDGKLTREEIERGGNQLDPIWSIQVRGRAAEFPDAWFAWLDEDHDRFLSERELVTASERLAQDFVFPFEPAAIPDTYVVQIARGNPMQDDQTFGFSKLTTSQPVSLPRWAVNMDSNGDGDISRIEFLGTPRQFDHFDDNADGFLDDREVIEGIGERRGE